MGEENIKYLGGVGVEVIVDEKQLKVFEATGPGRLRELEKQLTLHVRLDAESLNKQADMAIAGVQNRMSGFVLHPPVQPKIDHAAIEREYSAIFDRMRNSSRPLPVTVDISQAKESLRELDATIRSINTKGRTDLPKELTGNGMEIPVMSREAYAAVQQQSRIYAKVPYEQLFRDALKPLTSKPQASAAEPADSADSPASALAQAVRRVMAEDPVLTRLRFASQRINLWEPRGVAPRPQTFQSMARDVDAAMQRQQAFEELARQRYMPELASRTGYNPAKGRPASPIDSSVFPGQAELTSGIPLTDRELRDEQLARLTAQAELAQSRASRSGGQDRGLMSPMTHMGLRSTMPVALLLAAAEGFEKQGSYERDMTAAGRYDLDAHARAEMEHRGGLLGDMATSLPGAGQVGLMLANARDTLRYKIGQSIGNDLEAFRFHGAADKVRDWSGPGGKEQIEAELVKNQQFTRSQQILTESQWANREAVALTQQTGTDDPVAKQRVAIAQQYAAAEREAKNLAEALRKENVNEDEIQKAVQQRMTAAAGLRDAQMAALARQMSRETRLMEAQTLASNLQLIGGGIDAQKTLIDTRLREELNVLDQSTPEGRRRALAMQNQAEIEKAGLDKQGVEATMAARGRVMQIRSGMGQVSDDEQIRHWSKDAGIAQKNAKTLDEAIAIEEEFKAKRESLQKSTARESATLETSAAADQLRARQQGHQAELAEIRQHFAAVLEVTKPELHKQVEAQRDAKIAAVEAEFKRQNELAGLQTSTRLQNAQLIQNDPIHGQALAQVNNELSAARARIKQANEEAAVDDDGNRIEDKNGKFRDKDGKTYLTNKQREQQVSIAEIDAEKAQLIRGSAMTYATSFDAAHRVVGGPLQSKDMLATRLGALDKAKFKLQREGVGPENTELVRPGEGGPGKAAAGGMGPMAALSAEAAGGGNLLTAMATLSTAMTRLADRYGAYGQGTVM